MRRIVIALVLGVLTSAVFVWLRARVGLDGDSGLIVLLGCLPTGTLLRHFPPQYHSPVLLLGQALVWCGIWLLALSVKTHDSSRV